MPKCSSGGRLIGRAVLILFFFILLSAPMIKQARATHFYVDNVHGDNANNGLNPGNGAFGTLHHALQEMEFSGKPTPYTLHVTNTGTAYTKTQGGEDSPLKIGTNMPETTIKGYNGRPLIDGSGATTWVDGFSASDCSNITFSGLEIKNFKNTGILITQAATDCTIDDCLLNMNGGDGIQIAGSSNTVSNCQVYYNVKDSSAGGTAGIYLSATASGNTITGNKIYDNGEATGGSAKPGLKDEGSDTTISNNTIYWNNTTDNLQNMGILAKGDNTIISGNNVYGHGASLYVGIQCDGTAGLTLTGNQIYGNETGVYIDANDAALIAPAITRNYIHDNSAYGIKGAGGSSYGISPLIQNNLIYKNTSGGIYINDNGKNSFPEIYHNTLDGSASGEGVNVDGQAGTVPKLKYNIITKFGLGVTASGGTVLELDYNDVWGNVTANHDGVNPGNNGISADPLYGSYTLQSDSPCMDAIPDSAGDDAAVDIEGNARPLGSGRDMGCYEGASSNPKLIVGMYPDDGGGVVSSPEGIDCPDGACKEFFDPDSTVTLTAAPGAGKRFDHWEGGLKGVDNPGSLVMGEDDVTVTAVFTPESHTRAIPAGTASGDYVLYSAPLSADNSTPEGFFGIDADEYDTTRHRIGRWDPLNGTYKEFPWVGTVLPGRAYWLLMADGMNLTVSGPPAALVDDPLYGLPSCKVLVSKGWNMIGNPFQYPISLDNAVASFGGTNKNLLSASDCYVWNGGTYQTTFSLGVSEGGWVKASADGYVYFQAIVHDADDESDVRTDIAADADLPPDPPGAEDTTDTSGGSGGGGGGCYIESIMPGGR